ncbi:MAG: NifU N-terminal domain-containing protein [Chloroflexi bacterium]|nr:NifU N-terminal domain-containing protein [Chloroflexota bacterium]
MLIQVQKTPNPNALKFVLPEKKFAQPLNFASAEAASAHPLARQLFDLGQIYNVFMAQDFITVNKLPDAPWSPLDAKIQAVISQFFRDE